MSLDIDIVPESEYLDPSDLGPICPNSFPVTDSPHGYRIAFIGEAPSEDDITVQRPFSGQAGRFLEALLTNANISRSCCFTGNISQHRPNGNKFELFSWTGPEITSGLQQLARDLDQYNPHLCVLLGNAPLRAALGRGPSTVVSNWRGSLFTPNDVGSPFHGRKCLAAFHPAFVLREYSGMPLLLFDLRRARQEGCDATLSLPVRNIRYGLSHAELVASLREVKVCTVSNRVGFDIEGWVDRVSVLGFATTPNDAFVVEMVRPNGEAKWTLEEELQLWVLISDILFDERICKVMHNALYEMFVLSWSHKIIIRNYADTMCKHWENLCEMENNLAVVASLYTHEPYYKSERTTHDWDEFCRYNGKDCCVTLEADLAMDKVLTTADKAHYEFNLRLLYPLLYMELRGFKYDHKLAAQRVTEITQKSFAQQFKLNQYAGRAQELANITSLNELIYLANSCGVVKKSQPARSLAEVVNNAYSSEIDNAKTIERIGNEVISTNTPFTKSQIGELSIALSLHLNVDSTHAKGDMQWFLYEHKKYKPVFKKENGRLTTKRTTDAKALLTLFKRYNDDPVMTDILVMRSCLSQLETLHAKYDSDNRMRASRKLIGTETGRISTYQSCTGSGYNLSTTTKKQRDLFIADSTAAGDLFWFDGTLNSPDSEWGMDMCQCDLAGADGWTVAAWCKKLGDPTMWDDYKFGLKPAKIVALMHELGGEAVMKLSRSQLKELSKGVDGDSWIYMGAKQVQHGSSYLMGEITMSDTILKTSYKLSGTPVYVAPALCKRLQHFFFLRYPGVIKWHQYIANLILKTSKLQSASGHTRKFMGRKREGTVLNRETHGQALSDEPQNNTTHATNMALDRCWNDPDNRRDDGSLIIEPLHHVHDAMITQWPKHLRSWARNKNREFFNNPLTIADETFVIPFEGGFGPSWGETKEAL